jgi:hypothetical protein
MQSPNGSPKKVDFSANVKLIPNQDSSDAKDLQTQASLHLNPEVAVISTPDLPHHENASPTNEELQAAQHDFPTIETPLELSTSDAGQGGVMNARHCHAVQATISIPLGPELQQQTHREFSRPSPTLDPPSLREDPPLRLTPVAVPKDSAPEGHEADRDGGYEGSSSAQSDTPTSQSLPSFNVTSSPNDRKNCLRHMQDGEPIATEDRIQEGDSELIVSIKRSE